MELEDIRNALSSPIIPMMHNSGKNKIASVLIVIFGSEPKILMTKKSKILKVHAGEIAFPGGKFETGDGDLMETAIRESREEINLSITREHIVGQLSPVTTLNSGFVIIPFIAIVKRLPRLKDNPEVESILQIPLKELLQTLDNDKDPFHQSIMEMYVLKYKEHLIWGASARMLKQIHDKLSLMGLLGT